MRTIIAFSLLVYVIQIFLSVTISGVSAYQNKTILPFLIMIPGTLSMVIALVYCADKIYFNQIRFNSRSVFITSLSFFAVSLLLLFIGKFFTIQVDTIKLIPSYLVRFVWFPFLILFVKKFVKKEGVAA